MHENYKYIGYALVYLKQYWVKLLLILLMSSVIILLGLVPIELFRELIDEAIPANDLHMVVMMVLKVLGVFTALLFIWYLKDIMLTKLEINVARNIQVDFFRKLLHVPTSYYSHYSEGQLMERAIDDTMEITESTFDLVISPILEVVAVLITLAYMFTISWELTVLCLIFLPFFALLTIPVNRAIRKKYTAVKVLYADIYAVVQEKIAGLKEIITNNQRDYEKEQVNKHLKRYYDADYDYEKFSAKLKSLISLATEMAPYVILIYAAYMIIEGDFEIGTLVAFSMLMPNLFQSAQELADKEFELQTLGVTAKRVFTIIHDAKPVKQGDTELQETKGDIQFQDISYSVAGKTIFQDLNLSIKPNKMTCIVGEEGAGKTTLLNIILRALDIEKGHVLLDNKDITSFTAKSVRHHIAVVNQQPYMFSDTVLHNILYGHPEQKSGTADVHKAAHLAHIHENIMKLPNGYHTMIGKTTGVITAGQKHRIAIARALVRKPKILLLDQPETDLDEQSIHHLIRALENLRKNKTIVIITNEPRIASKADEVIIIEKKQGIARVKKTGTPREVAKEIKTYGKAKNH